jgi:hypothetical protein
MLLTNKSVSDFIHKNKNTAGIIQAFLIASLSAQMRVPARNLNLIYKLIRYYLLMEYISKNYYWIYLSGNSSVSNLKSSLYWVLKLVIKYGSTRCHEN